jgi:hypothetical protein
MALVNDWSSAVIGDPGERQFHRCGPGPAQPPQEEDHDTRDERPAEREPHIAVQRGGPEHPDRQDDREGRPGAHPENARVGERIAGQGLHQRAGQAERGARRQAEQGAGHAHRPDDVVDEAAGRMAEDRAHDLVERDAERAQGDRQQRQQDEEGDDQCHQHRGAKPSA